METKSFDLAELKRKQQRNESLFRMPTGSSYKIQILKTPVPIPYYLEIGDTHFRFNSAVFLPNSLEQSHPEESEDAYSSGIALIERICYTTILTDGKIFITGHADTVGGYESNTTLSEYRAATVYSILTGDRELFKNVSNAPHVPDKVEKHNLLINDQLQICDWASAEFGWPCSQKQNYNDYLRTFKAFQRSYNDNNFAENTAGTALAVDGDWGPATWGATFDCYELKLSRRLMIPRTELTTYRNKIKLKDRFMFADKPYTGCGEYHPIDMPNRDNYNSKTNRRVEIFFFPPNKPAVVTCSSGDCNGKACTFYEPMLPLRGKKMEARWTEPLTKAGHCENREMTLICQDIAAGDDVSFEPYQLHNGELTKLVPALKSVSADAGSASAKFEERSDAIFAYYPVNSAVKGFSYFFLAHHKNFSVLSARQHAVPDGALFI